VGSRVGYRTRKKNNDEYNSNDSNAGEKKEQKEEKKRRRCEMPERLANCIHKNRARNGWVEAKRKE
jgi:hypothetical protein